MKWTTAIVLFLIAAVLVRTRSLAFWLYMAVIVLLAARLIVRLTLTRLRLVHRVDRDHLFPGERLGVTLTVANGSPLPAPWVWVEDRVPTKLHHGPIFSHVSTLPPGSERVHRYELQVSERGVYRIGYVDVSVGDWFGLREMGGTVVEPRWITVYPRVVPVAPLRLPNRLPVGPRRDPLSPFQDLLPIGLRHYLPGDPLRLIAWKATAHRGELMVKEQPLVRERVTYYFLNLSRGDWDPSRRFELLERAVTVAASLVWSEPDAQHSLGLVAYGRVEHSVLEGTGRELGEPGVLRVAARAGATQRRAILESLAALQPADGRPFLDVLAEEVRTLPWGATLVLLVPTNTSELVAMCTEFRRHGHPVVILTFEPRRVMESSIPIHEVEMGMQEVRFA